MIAVILSLIISVSRAWAQESASSSAPTSAVQTPAESKPAAQREDIDQEITNARLRAATGAKSLLSLQTAFTYNGGSIEDPLGQTRPQLSPGVVENDPAKLTGTAALKYRASDHDNINLGIGLGWLTPTYAGQHGQVEDPYAGYSRTFRAGDVQNVLNTQMTKYTAQSSVAQNLAYEYEIDHTVLTGIGKTKWQLGLNVEWSHEFYTQAPSSTSAVQDEVAGFPFVEYEFNKKFSFRTVYRGLTYFNTTAATGTFTQDSATQSMGVGISVARDVYLYPNVQWVWADMRPDKTNVAIAANINAF